MLSPEGIIEHRDKKPPEFPFMGAKQFEPSSSDIHSIENVITATGNLLSFPTIRQQGYMSKVGWRPDMFLGEVTSMAGSHWSFMGHVLQQKLYVHPEEALYLLEAGLMEITYNEMSLSIERAHHVLLHPKTDLTLDQYRVYAYLISNGYRARRHSQDNSLTQYEKQIDILKAGVKRKLRKMSAEEPKKFRNEETAETMDTSLPENSTDDSRLEGNLASRPTLEICFDAWLSDSKVPFKKTCVQLPHCRIMVSSHEDPVPNPSDLTQLSSQFSDGVPLISAIVFPDFVTFYQLACIELPHVGQFLPSPRPKTSGQLDV